MDITVTNIEPAPDMATLAWTVQYSDHNIINKKEKNGTESEEGKMEACRDMGDGRTAADTE
jgi:hypothetical protein